MSNHVPKKPTAAKRYICATFNASIGVVVQRPKQCPYCKGASCIREAAR